MTSVREFVSKWLRHTAGELLWAMTEGLGFFVATYSMLLFKRPQIGYPVFSRGSDSCRSSHSVSYVLALEVTRPLYNVHLFTGGHSCRRACMLVGKHWFILEAVYHSYSRSQSVHVTTYCRKGLRDA